QQLTHTLSNEPGFLVASRTAAMQFKNWPQDLGAVGRKLHVTAVVESSEQRRENRIHIVAQLISVGDGYQVWSENYEFPVEEAGHYQDEVTKLIARTLRARFAGVSDPHASQRCADSDANRMYARGRDEWLTQRSPGVEKAVSLYEQAVTKDARCALAYA